MLTAVSQQWENDMLAQPLEKPSNQIAGLHPHVCKFPATLAQFGCWPRSRKRISRGMFALLALTSRATSRKLAALSTHVPDPHLYCISKAATFSEDDIRRPPRADGCDRQDADINANNSATKQGRHAFALQNKP